jgi:uncharacterized RDD family membrane protein YckC
MSEVVTGEAVVLELPVASFPGRLVALIIDMIIQAALGLLAALGLSVLLSGLNGDYIAAVVVSAELAITVVYATLWETMTRGKTPGKMALGLRVVGEDGSPERFRQALVRSLVGLIEIYSLPPVALITSIVSTKGKRLGDIFAGTYVLQERMPARAALPPVFTTVPPPLLGWAQSLQLSALSDQTADAASSYLRRFAELTPRARESLGHQIATAVAAEVSPPPPPGTPPAAFLAAVLAVRRERDHARASTNVAAAPPPPAPPPPPPVWLPLAGPTSQPEAVPALPPTAAPPITPPPPTPAPPITPPPPVPAPPITPPPPTPAPPITPPPPTPTPTQRSQPGQPPPIQPSPEPDAAAAQASGGSARGFAPPG